MHSPDFWKAFHSKPDLSTDTTKIVETLQYTYQISQGEGTAVNRVGYITGQPEKVFAELQRIYAGKGFAVSVRDTDHPDLVAYLTDHDYSLSKTIDLRILEVTPEAIPQFFGQNRYQGKEIDREGMLTTPIYNLMHMCFPQFTPDFDSHKAINDTMYEMAEASGSQLFNYALFDGEVAVAFGSFFDLGNFRGKRIAQLSGAATHPNYRKQGLYTSMLALRCQMALDKGIDVLYVHADQETSSPILAKYGFTVVETIKEYLPRK